jgi:hypothetical protein
VSRIGTGPIRSDPIRARGRRRWLAPRVRAGRRWSGGPGACGPRASHLRPLARPVRRARGPTGACAARHGLRGFRRRALEKKSLLDAKRSLHHRRSESTSAAWPSRERRRAAPSTQSSVDLRRRRVPSGRHADRAGHPPAAAGRGGRARSAHRTGARPGRRPRRIGHLRDSAPCHTPSAPCSAIAPPWRSRSLAPAASAPCGHHPESVVD